MFIFQKQSFLKQQNDQIQTPKSLKKLIKFSFKKILILMTSTKSSLIFQHIIGIKKTITD